MANLYWKSLKIADAALLCVMLPAIAWGATTSEPEFARGWDLLQQNKYAEARTSLEAGMKNSPSNSAAHFYLADACRGLKDWVCAEEHYSTSLELAPTSSVAELAKARLRKAKGWRLLEETRRVIEENDPPKFSVAEEKLTILKSLQLDDEQAALHTLLAQKLKGKFADNMAATSASSEMSVRQRLNGHWKFRDGQGVYRIIVQSNGEIKMTLEKKGEGVLYAVGDPLLRGFAIERPNKTDLSIYLGPSLITLFTRDAAFVSTGYRKTFFEIPSQQKFMISGELLRCPKKVKYREVIAVLAYIPVIDTIRLLTLQGPQIDMRSCEISFIDLAPNSSDASDIEELVRVD